MDTLQLMKEYLLEVTPNVSEDWVDCDDEDKGTTLVESGWSVFSHKHGGQWEHDNTPENAVETWYEEYLKRQKQK